MVHAEMFESKAREREILANSITHVRADDLLLLDREFPSYWLFAWLTECQRHFCIRVRLPSGQTEFLATSLLDSDAFPASGFADLYHRRWRIEECFKLLKCRLAVEHFSGELPESTRQDFMAKVWLGNLGATFAYLAHASLPPKKPQGFTPNGPMPSRPSGQPYRA